jgi:excisionase family DNA binding protein
MIKRLISMTKQPLTMTIDAAAQKLGVCRNTAYSAAKAGEIPVVKIGRRMLVPIAAFERMLGQADQPKPASEGA